MKFKALIGTSVLAMTVATPAFAQDAADEVERDAFGGEIVVTAQRQSERLQDVPIAVSAFSTEALEAQQIKTPSDLQLTLPNVTFTKTNFTGASFTIRGIGDLCVGTTCDSATAIHLNGDPLFSTCSKPNSSTSNASKCCAGRRAPCLAATRPRAWST